MAAAQAPALRVVHARPLVVGGTGFHARESVTVTVRMGSGRWSARRVTGRDGAFTARFGTLRLRYCSLPLTITARGARGEVASAPLPRVDCANR